MKTKRFAYLNPHVTNVLIIMMKASHTNATIMSKVKEQMLTKL